MHTWGVRQRGQGRVGVGRGRQLIHPPVLGLPVLGIAHAGRLCQRHLGRQPRELLVRHLVPRHGLQHTHQTVQHTMAA